MEVPVASDYRQLRIWQGAMDLAEHVQRLTGTFPAGERFGITLQLRRAAVSVPSCIAEGNARGSTRDYYLRFLSMSAGSLAEVETQLLLASRFGYISESALAPVLTTTHAVARQLQALRNALSKKLAPTTPFPVSRSPFPSP
ncbi:MAG: four helix bundle protein [Frateuria sp.]|uniref:four helix bundle protein n=1 Tax=Frateuria sp. TaxID=2211372 RepID=UPI00178DACEF|nr:four helix bundle protein [Frateuria sp.]NUO72659.1 four helix bundle protein [Frateuria sp.]NUR23662.1 four helix bundle protein [Frateuria sp.]